MENSQLHLVNITSKECYWKCPDHVERIAAETVSCFGKNREEHVKHYKPCTLMIVTAQSNYWATSSPAWESGQMMHHLSITNGRCGHLLSPEAFPGCKVAPKNKCFTNFKGKHNIKLIFLSGHEYNLLFLHIKKEIGLLL